MGNMVHSVFLGGDGMKTFISILTWLILTLTFASFQANAQTISRARQVTSVPDAPSVQAGGADDSPAFHRGEDYAFGALVSTIGGMGTRRPWLGLLMGECAGVANEARYGRNFSYSHLGYISAGALTGYVVSKWEHHVEIRQRRKYGR